jgi:uncharacterized membrane protein YedE/YeeE
MSARTLNFVGISGALFGFGLALSTMVKPEVVLLVLGGAVAVTFVSYQLLPRVMAKPWTGDSFGRHPSEMSARTLAGAAIFGIGWGLSGVCPGPAIAGLGVGNWPLLLSLAGLAAGGFIQGLFFAPKSP